MSRGPLAPLVRSLAVAWLSLSSHRESSFKGGHPVSSNDDVLHQMTSERSSFKQQPLLLFSLRVLIDSGS